MLRRHKKLTIFVSVATVLAMASIAFAYFTTTGAGTGDATVGTNTALVLNQASITYSNSATDNVLLPGTSATVTFTVDNPSSGNQYLDTISVTSVSADASHTDCNSTLHPTWFDLTDTDVVGHNYAPGDGQAVAGDLTVDFVDQPVSQDVCKNATLTFHYASN
jgi:hypothetical protein